MKPKPRQSVGPEKTTGHRKWPPEVRLQMAQAVVDRRTPLATVAQVFGIPGTTVAEWARRYRKYGTDTKRWAEEGKPAAEGGESFGARGGRAASGGGGNAAREPGTRHAADTGRDGALPGPGGLGDDGAADPARRRATGDRTRALRRSRGPYEHRFERAEPNQLWQSDIFTFLLRRHQRLYVTAFMDDYSRYLVSLVVAHHQRAALVLEALARGIADYGAPREVLTDQGRQYVAWRGHTDFEEELRRQGIRHIKSRPHHPQTLGKIERFWKTLWEEFLSRTVFADFEDCQRRIGLFVQAYNFRRPHQGIEGAVPADRFFRAAPQVRDAIEKGVAANALALAQEHPRRKPFYLVGRLGEQDFSVALAGAGLMVRLGDLEETIAAEGRREMKTRGRRCGSRRHRPRPTPKWLLKSEEIDRIAQQRCLMVLSVLSGEKPVTEAIEAAGISRGTYYQLETRALNAMLRALGPLAERRRAGDDPRRQIAALEAKVKSLEQAGRRGQRLLLMTRRVIASREKRTSSTRPGKGPSRSSRGRSDVPAPGFDADAGWRGRALSLGA